MAKGSIKPIKNRDDPGHLRLARELQPTESRKKYVPASLLKCPKGARLNAWIYREVLGKKTFMMGPNAYYEFGHLARGGHVADRAVPPCSLNRDFLGTSLTRIRKLKLHNYFLNALWETTGSNPGFVLDDSKWNVFMATPLQICQAIWMIRRHLRRAKKEETDARKGPVG